MDARVYPVVAALLVWGCGDGEEGTAADAAAVVDARDGGVAVGDARDGGVAGGDARGADAPRGDAAAVGPDAAVAFAPCPPLAPPSGGSVVDVATVGALVAAVDGATPGRTIRLAAGTYDVSAAQLWIDTPGVVLRGVSGDREAVRLVAAHANTSGGVLSIVADDVVVADLTIVEPRFHAIHVFGGTDTTSRVRITNVHVVDPGEQAIKINSNTADADDGEVSCSHLELTRAGATFVTGQVSAGSRCYTGGVDAHRARGWTVRDNLISGFWCAGEGGEYLSEHAVHFWRGSRDTVVERNRLVNNARGVGFGLDETGRTYADAPCPGVSSAGHFGGLVRNNLIVGNDPAMFASGNGMDSGIALWYACGATVVHNTVAATGTPFSAIEWRFPITRPLVANNLATGRLLPRDEAEATTAGNLAAAATSLFVDLAGGDAHLGAGAAAAIDHAAAAHAAIAGADVDGDPRGGAPDIGADERR